VGTLFHEIRGAGPITRAKERLMVAPRRTPAGTVANMHVRAEARGFERWMGFKTETH
jgi:hypothetical protein